MKIIARKQAKAEGEKFYFTGKLCKHGHTASRRVCDGVCTECSREWKENNTDRIKQYETQYKTNNCDLIKKRSQQHYLDNAEQYKQRTKEHRQNNPEQCRKYFEDNIEKYRQYAKRWRQKNPHKTNESARIRKQSMLVTQKPSWSNDKEIKQLYLMRDYLNTLWGTNFEVDHIIPLQGKAVSGLHCWENLQLLDKALNLSKNRSFQQDW